MKPPKRSGALATVRTLPSSTSIFERYAESIERATRILSGSFSSTSMIWYVPPLGMSARRVPSTLLAYTSAVPTRASKRPTFSVTYMKNRSSLTQVTRSMWFLEP